MLEDVAALAMTGATTVVAAMATDAWTTARARVARLFRHAGTDQQAAIEAQMDGHAALVARSGDTEGARQDLVPVWRLQLAAFLREHPDAAEELQQLLDEVRAELPPARQVWQQTNTARDNGRVFAALGGNVIVHQGPAEPPAPPRPAAGTETEDAG
ncbi:MULTISPECIES: hypothetical protein [unclassified Streptomyces]|uniref:hypothetical protein n=1 Tax=unclassified Streptomyces TaxID=2593676 RepID=UPI000DC7C1C6|nr:MULTISPECIES: hypothetical protein [unclassified Streptomyces]AWZ07387.1 hypothetical protein DRB89_25410 [Streptomyces sp. ICC4]AWZ13926.1 hypothetical protein DRB96_18330 [Streptomyces sp. ICC1]